MVSIDAQEHGSVLPPSQPPPCPTLNWWNNDFSRRFRSESNDPVTIELYLKVSVKTFDYICSIVSEDIMKKYDYITDVKKNPLSAKDRVAIALRKLSSGELSKSYEDSIGVQSKNVNRVTWLFVEAMDAKALHHLHWPPMDYKLKKIKKKFKKIQGLPNCCGAIASTKFIFRPLIEGYDKWLDEQEQGNYSMILYALVGPNMRFLNILTGFPRSNHVKRRLKFFQYSQVGKRFNGDEVKLGETEDQVGEYIIGDSEFPLLSWLLTPYQGESLSDSQKDFNNRLMKTHEVVKLALVKLRKRWGILNNVLTTEIEQDRLSRIIRVCCTLQNILIDLDDSVQQGNINVNEYHDPEYKEQVSDYIDEVGSDERDKLARYLST